MLREIYFFNLGVITGGPESWCLLTCSLCLSTYQHIFVWPENLARTKSYNIQIFLFLCLLLNWRLLNNHSLFLKRDLFIHKMHHWRKSKSCIFFFLVYSPAQAAIDFSGPWTIRKSLCWAPFFHANIWNDLRLRVFILYYLVWTAWWELSQCSTLMPQEWARL